MLTELLISSTQVAENSSADAHISVHNLHTSTYLLGFKQSSVPQNAIGFSDSLIFAAQSDKAVLNIYSYHGEAIEQKTILPEKLCVVSATENWLAGGTNGGRLYFWEQASGNLLFVRDAHYQAMTCMQFSRDGSKLITGGDDAVVYVWRVAHLVSAGLRQDDVQPLHIYRDHSRSISALQWGLGTRSYSCSLDGSVRVRQGETALTTFVLPHEVTAMVVEPAERAAYAGCNDGTIHCIGFYSGTPLHALGGRGAVISAGRDEAAIFRGASSVILCLEISFDASLLVSGDDSGAVLLWDVASRQLLKTIKQHKGLVSSIRCCLQPEDFKTPNKVRRHIPQLKRAQVQRDFDEHEVWIQLQGIIELDEQEDDAQEARKAFKSLAVNRSKAVVSAETLHLEEELSRVTAIYSEMKELYDRLYKEHVELRLSMQ